MLTGDSCCLNFFPFAKKDRKMSEFNEKSRRGMKCPLQQFIPCKGRDIIQRRDEAVMKKRGEERLGDQDLKDMKCKMMYKMYISGQIIPD
jgi:hypothetical protein